MSPEAPTPYRPFAAIERSISQKAEIAKGYPQQIGIDGLSAVGKGTLADKLSDLLGIPYFNTGIVYRAITVTAQMENIPVQQLTDAELTKALKGITIFYPGTVDAKRIEITTDRLPKQDVSYLTQTEDVEFVTSRIVAPRMPTRLKVQALQAQFLQNNPSCVMEGRNMREIMKDIPSENKFLMYLFASPDELAKRLQSRRDESFEEAQQSVVSRIRADYNREHGRVFHPHEAQISGEYNLTLDSTFMQHPEVVLTTLTAFIEKVQGQTSTVKASLPLATGSAAVAR